jgi:hypothetical protein
MFPALFGLGYVEISSCLVLPFFANFSAGIRAGLVQELAGSIEQESGSRVLQLWQG